MKKIILATILILSQISFSQTVDQSFGDFSGYTIGQQDYSYYDMLIIDQNIYAMSASIAESMNVSKYNLNGIIDSTFGQNGFKNVSGSDNVFGTMFNNAQNLHRSVDNKLLITAGYNYNTTNKIICTKLNLDGTLDTSYGVSGQVFSTLPGRFEMRAVRQFSNDALLIFGINLYGPDDSQGTQMIIKIDSQGNYDTSFGTNGVFNLPYSANLDEATFSGESIYFIQRDVYVYLTKFDLDTLSYDLSFATNGQLLIDNYFPNQEIRNFSIDDNDIYILGDFENSNQSRETFVVKLSNTILDTSFGINGLGRFPILSDNAFIGSFSIKKHSDKLFIFGEIANAQNMYSAGSFLAKLNIDGTVDENFGNGGVYIDTLLDTQSFPTTYLYLDDSIILAGMSLVPEVLGQPFMAKYLVENNLAVSQNTMEKFAYYPNPVRDYLHFQNEEEISAISIYDVVGRLIKSTIIAGSKIDLSFLKSGNYIIKATSLSKVETFKIVKI